MRTITHSHQLSLFLSQSCHSLTPGRLQYILRLFSHTDTTHATTLCYYTLYFPTAHTRAECCTSADYITSFSLVLHTATLRSGTWHWSGVTIFTTTAATNARIISAKWFSTGIILLPVIAPIASRCVKAFSSDQQSCVVDSVLLQCCK